MVSVPITSERIPGAGVNGVGNQIHKHLTQLIEIPITYRVFSSVASFNRVSAFR